jgi:hypothetical protein
MKLNCIFQLKAVESTTKYNENKCVLIQAKEACPDLDFEEYI